MEKIRLPFKELSPRNILDCFSLENHQHGNYSCGQHVSKMNTKRQCLYTTWRVEKVSFFAFSALFIWITQTGHTENLCTRKKTTTLFFCNKKTNMPIKKKGKFSPVQHGLLPSLGPGLFPAAPLLHPRDFPHTHQLHLFFSWARCI